MYKVLAEETERKKKYFQDYLYYGKKIKKEAEKILPHTRVLLFGSAIKGQLAPDSDLDILIISSQVPQNIFERSKLKIEIEEEFPHNPFELHLLTPKDYQNWYKKFIGKDFVEVD